MKDLNSSSGDRQEGFEHDRCRWQKKGVRKGAKQGVMRNGSEQYDYVLTVSHVVARIEYISFNFTKYFILYIEM